MCWNALSGLFLVEFGTWTANLFFGKATGVWPEVSPAMTLAWMPKVSAFLRHRVVRFLRQRPPKKWHAAQATLANSQQGPELELRSARRDSAFCWLKFPENRDNQKHFQLHLLISIRLLTATSWSSWLIPQITTMPPLLAIFISIHTNRLSLLGPVTQLK